MKYDDIPKYRKRRKRHTPRKSDHRHDYTLEVLVEKKFKDGLTSYYYARQCSICGKIGHEKIFETESCNDGRYNRILSQGEILEKYKGLKIVRDE